ncbi:MAG: 3-ketoacyl-ACP reductase [Planctomycetia bacterium]|nr:3-ketoacyl-ACP reductase [Planctomycetia bacterium]
MPERPVAIVTGASRGIGKAIASELARMGFDLVITHLDFATGSKADDSAAAEAKKEIEGHGADCLAVRSDISSSVDREGLLALARERFRRCDMLVNNAGVAPLQRADLLDATEESFDRVISINLKGPYFLTQAVARWMIEQKQEFPKRAFRIVNIGSLSAYTSSPKRGEYCISKAGIAMMTKLFADRLAEFGIGVFEVRPGIIATDMTAAVKEKYDGLIGEGLTPTRRWGRPEDVARAVAALASGRLDFSTGQVINVDGGFHLRRL